MKKVTFSKWTAALIAGTVMAVGVNATDIPNPANVTSTGSYQWIWLDDSDRGTWAEWGMQSDNVEHKFELFDTSDGPNENSRTPLTIMNSINNDSSFFVDTSGDIFLANGAVFVDRSSNAVGLGTTVPLHDLHLGNANPSIGFGTGTGGAHMAEFIDGFGIGPGADSNYPNPFAVLNDAQTAGVLTVGNDMVGINTLAPTNASLDVRGNVFATDEITASYSGSYPAGDGMKRVFRGISNNTAGGSYGSDAGFTLRNDLFGREWLFRTFSDGRGFSVTQLNTGGPEFYVNNLTGDYRDAIMVLGNGFYVDANGQAHNASSRSYKENIVGLDADKAMEAFDKMQTVTYNFKKDKSKEHMVGFIAEDVPDLVATKDRKTVDPLKIVALLNAVVHAQEEKLAAKDAEMEAMKADQAAMQAKIDRLEAMQERLTRLETILSNVAHSEALGSKDTVSLIEK